MVEVHAAHHADDIVHLAFKSMANGGPSLPSFLPMTAIPPPQVLAGLRVLVVEDEAFIASDLALSLEELGARVMGPVASCGEAHRLIDTYGVPDVAVLDINLFDETVFPVADRLQQLRTPFVFMTGYGRDAMPSRYRDALRCEKPVVMADLIAMLQRVSGGPSSRRGTRSPVM